MVLLDKISLENLLEQNTLYSKLVRGKLPFKVEVHTLNEGKNVQLYFYRDEDRIEDFIKTGFEKGVLTEQNTEIQSEVGVFRLIVNEERFMINSAGKATIKVREINFSKKDVKIKDFPHGKVAILIDMEFEDGIDNSKLKKEIKDYFMEVQDGQQ